MWRIVNRIQDTSANESDGLSTARNFEGDQRNPSAVRGTVVLGHWIPAIHAGMTLAQASRHVVPPWNVATPVLWMAPPPAQKQQLRSRATHPAESFVSGGPRGGPRWRPRNWSVEVEHVDNAKRHKGLSGCPRVERIADRLAKVRTPCPIAARAGLWLLHPCEVMESQWQG